MALFQLFHEPRSANFDVATLVRADETTIEIASGTLTFDFYGVGLTYDSGGDLVAGAFKGFEIFDSANGGLQASASGFNVDVWAFIDAFDSPDGDALDRLLMTGDDTLIGAAGNDSLDGYGGADSIVGNAGDDSLDGGDDSLVDTLVGGAGNDTYLLGGAASDLVVEVAGGGTDTVFTSLTYVLGADLENLVLTGSAPINGTGNASDNYIKGNDGGNVLEGLAGNDTLEASFYGPGDTMRGGAGNDTYIGSGNLVIEEAPGEGTDTVLCAMSGFTMPDNVENLTCTYSGGFNATGNALANVIIGNSTYDNQLRGGAGNDTLIGGSGNDVYGIDDLGDVIQDPGGNDAIETTLANYVLPDRFVNLTRVTAGQGTGNAGNNFIQGSLGADTLWGVAGDDTLDGVGGTDVLDGGAGTDHARFGRFLEQYSIAHSGNDLVVTLKDYPTESATVRNIERLDFYDLHLAFDIAGDAGQAYRLYQAAFDRTPDQGGLGYWINVLDHGASLHDVSNGFLASAEFAQKYGSNLDTHTFVAQLYANVLHRAPDASGASYWEGVLNQSATTRADVLAFFSESSENQANVIGAIENGIVYSL